MRTIAIMLTNLLLCISMSLMATEKDAEKTKPKNFTDIPTPAIVNDINSNKKAWAENVEQKLPELLCDKNQYFVQCFDVTEPECLEFTKLLVHACLSNVTLALPQQIDPQQGEYWGQMIGRCSYDLYNKYMETKKHHTKVCTGESKKDDLPKPSQALP